MKRWIPKPGEYVVLDGVVGESCRWDGLVLRVSKAGCGKGWVYLVLGNGATFAERKEINIYVDKKAAEAGRK